MMHTLDDLRHALREHGDSLDDTDRYVRPVAVRERIRVVRRRRATAAGVAAAVAAAAIAAASTLSLPDRVQPADHTVAGVDVPGSVRVYGFPYELDRTRSVAGDTRVHLDRAGAERAVSLIADGLGRGYVTLLRDGEAIARATGDDDVEPPVPVAADDTTLRLRLDGAPDDARVGLAVYRSTGEPAAGVGNGTAVFRTTVADDRLVTAAFSDPGSERVTVRFTDALSDVRLSEYCRTDDPGYWLNVSLDGDRPVVGQCSNDDTRDPGTSWASFSGAQVRQHTLSAYFTLGEDGPRVAPPDGVLGVGVYRLAAGARRVLGLDVPRTTEYGGRTWVLSEVVPGTEDGHPVAVDARDEDRLLGFVARGRTAWASWHGRMLNGESTRMSSAAGAGGAGSAIAGLLPRGDSYDVRMHGGGPSYAAALLVYRPV